MVDMRFWRLHKPEYDSDYQSLYVNGDLEHPFGLPGLTCDVCGATWSDSRILHYECPHALREKKHLNQKWPISLAEHQALQDEVGQAFLSAGHEAVHLRPGDAFQPCYLDIASRPRPDFLWASVGSAVVSDRIRGLFESLAIDEVAFCPVAMRKVGKREATVPPPIPASGEPEDLVREAPLLEKSESVGPYYEMIVLSESRRPPGADPVSVCSACGRETIDNTRRSLVMDASIWKGTDVFFLATTLHIIISDRLKIGLGELRATNAAFSECGAA